MMAAAASNNDTDTGPLVSGVSAAVPSVGIR